MLILNLKSNLWLPKGKCGGRAKLGAVYVCFVEPYQVTGRVGQVARWWECALQGGSQSPPLQKRYEPMWSQQFRAHTLSLPSHLVLFFFFSCRLLLESLLLYLPICTWKYREQQVLGGLLNNKYPFCTQNSGINQQWLQG